MLRTLVQAIGRGAPAQAAFPAARDNHGSRNRSIAIAKLITKFHGEGDPITYVEQFEQICAAFGDVSDGDKIGAFGIQLEGKAGAWYRALKDEEKETWDTLRGSFILEYSPKGPKWSPVNQLNQVKQGKDSLRDYIAKIKHLNARCEPHERLSDEQLLPRFLLGLRSPKLHD